MPFQPVSVQSRAMLEMRADRTLLFLVSGCSPQCMAVEQHCLFAVLQPAPGITFGRLCKIFCPIVYYHRALEPDHAFRNFISRCIFLYFSKGDHPRSQFVKPSEELFQEEEEILLWQTGAAESPSLVMFVVFSLSYAF